MAEKSENSGQGVQSQDIKRAEVAADGSIVVPCCEAELVSVDVADVDLLLGFSDGTYVVIPNGALDALSGSAPQVMFVDPAGSAFTQAHFSSDHIATLDELFKMVGTTDAAKAGSLRVASEGLDVAQDGDVEVVTVQNDTLPTDQEIEVFTADSGTGAGDLVPNAELSEAVLLDPVVPDIPPRPSVAGGSSGHKVFNVAPTIILDSITSDNIINVAESDPANLVTISGRVGGTATVGDIVTLTINGTTVTTSVLDDLTFSADVSGDILAPQQGIEGLTGAVDAEVVDQSGNVAYVDPPMGYSIDTLAPQPTITLDPIVAGDGIVNQSESQGTITLTGTVSEAYYENLAGDLITLTINGTDYTGYVLPDGHNFSVNVPGSALAPTLGVEGGSGTIDARIDSVDGAGNSGFAVDLGNSFQIDTAEPTPTITVNDITSDNIVNIAESGGDVAVTGAVSGGKIGDSVSLSLNDVIVATGSVRADGTFSINVSGGSLRDACDVNNSGTLHAQVDSYDSAGNLGSGSFDKVYSLDDIPPSATITIDDTALKFGDTAEVTITFDAPVTDFTNSDLNFENGTLTDVSSTDGGVTWKATFTPFVPIEDPSNLITLNNAGVQDAAGNPGVGSTSSPNFAIDTLNPQVNDVTATLPGSNLAFDPIADAHAGQTLSVSVTFSEAMDQTVDPTLVFIDNLTGFVIDPTGSLLDSGGGWDATGTVFTKTYLVQDGNIDVDNMNVDVTGAQDAAGNAMVDYVAETEFGIDTLNPTVTILDDNQDGVVNASDSLVTYTLDFSEEITSLNLSDLLIEGGDYVDGSLVFAPDGTSATFQAIAFDSSDKDLKITVKNSVTDLNGNTLVEASHSLPVDTLNPRVTIATDNLDGTVSDNDILVTYTLTFDKPVVAISDSDLTILGGDLTSSPVLAADGLSARFSVTAYDNSTANLEVTVNDSIVDQVGRPLLPATNTLAVDTTNPTVISIIEDNLDGVVSGPDNVVNYTVNFSREVASVTAADVSVAGGTLNAPPVLAADGMSATFSVTAYDDSTLNLVVNVKNSIVDLNGNALVPTQNNILAVDTKDPEAFVTISDTLITDADATVSVVVNFTEAMSRSVTPTLTFSQDVTGILSKSLQGWYNADRKFVVIYDVLDTNVDLSDIKVSVTGGRDVNGNLFQGINDAVVFGVDTLNPSVTIVEDNLDGVVSDLDRVVHYTLNFSEEVVSVSASDLSITGGTLTSGPVLAADGLSATFSVTAWDMSTADLVVTVNNTIVDINGNPLNPASNTLTVDTTVHFPDLTCELYTSSEFKVTGGSGNPAGSYVAGASEAEHLVASSPAGQATRERIDGTAGNDVIDHNANFSADAGQWAKNLHLDFFVYEDLTKVELIADPAISGISNFDFEAAGLVRSGDTWTLDISDPAVVADLLANGLDVRVVYDVADTGGPIDFNVVVNVSGLYDGGVPYDISQTLPFSWRDATTEADFNLTQAGNQVMVLPRDGLGVDIYAGDGDDQVYAGAGHDTVYGAAGIDTLDGGQGNDLLFGGTDNDILIGAEGEDVLYGEQGDDSLSGGLDNDLLVGGAGADQLDGGSGIDTVSYAGSTADVVASLATGLGSGGDAEGDQYISIENLIGGDGNDILIGNVDANVLDGGLGNDTASYADSLAGVTASLVSGSGTAGDALGDSYVGIENLTGGAGADTLIGDAGDNILTGGGAGDALYGGGGTDTASYADASQGVIAALDGSLYDFQTNDAAGDTFDQIENLLGSIHDDSLFGNTSDNVLDGGLGNDRLYGSAGNDTLWADQGHDIARGDIGADTIHISSNAADLPTAIDGGADTDTLVVDGLSSVVGNYDFSDLAGLDARLDNLEILDIREGTDLFRADAATTIEITGQDILNMVDGGTELTVLADSGDILDLSAFTAVGETCDGGTLIAPNHTEYVISDGGGEIARIQWFVA